MRSLNCGALVAALFLLTIGFRAAGAAKAAIFDVRRPTVVAFYPPVSDSDRDDPDADEALSNFQYYADEVRAPLRHAGVDFHEVYARSFSIRVRGKIIEFRTARKDDVGYYFIAPGKKAHVEYGIMTDDDLLSAAHDYFGIPIPDKSESNARELPPLIFLQSLITRH
jgi:hypothetical protein